MTTYRDAADPDAAPEQIHERDIEGMPTAALEERYFDLTEYHAGRVAVDPRCGCTGSCYWDDARQIDDELGRRGR